MVRLDFLKAKLRTRRFDAQDLRGIKAVVMDVDGILTDCKILDGRERRMAPGVHGSRRHRHQAHHSSGL